MGGWVERWMNRGWVSRITGWADRWTRACVGEETRQRSVRTAQPCTFHHTTEKNLCPFPFLQTDVTELHGNISNAHASLLW